MQRFESSVNSEYSKTILVQYKYHQGFESSVNSEYSKTDGYVVVDTQSV